MTRRVPGLPLLDHPDVLEPAWLEGIVRHAGFEAKVSGFEASPVGTGQMADSYRLRLVYEGDPGGAPETVVIKVPAANATSRQSGAAGAYQTEVRFYQELSGALAIRTPHCFHADISDENDAFVLVLEDMAPCEQGDQIRGCSVDEAEGALRNLAGLHAPSWDARGLADKDFIRRADAGIAKMMSTVLSVSTETFIERYASRMAEGDAEVLRHFAAHSERWLLETPGRQCLVHGDYRLDNLLFATARGGTSVATVDWQTVSLGSPGRDVAYFLGNSLAPEARREHERGLLAVYLEELQRQGVDGYGLDDCFEDYRHGQFQGPLVTVLGSIAVEVTERGDAMFMAMCSRACQAIRDLDSDALL